MDKIYVALVDLGELLPIDLKYLAKRLNTLQSSFSFKDVESVTMAKIGEPRH